MPCPHAPPPHPHPTQALRASSGPSPEKALNTRAQHSKPTLRRANDCMPQVKTLCGKGAVASTSKVSRPGPQPSSPASWLPTRRRCPASPGCLPPHPFCLGWKPCVHSVRNSQSHVPFQLWKIRLPTRDKSGWQSGHWSASSFASLHC